MPSVYWLSGLAGTGKTTIAQTVAERTFAEGRLGASFFCSRNFEDRSNLKLIFPTLAVQLARNYPGFRSLFVPMVQANPELVHESLYNQMGELIVRPLVKSAISTVIVIDALDECTDEEPASAILSVLGRFVGQIPSVKFFVTGRPESHIREGFRLPPLAEVTDVFVLHQVEPSRADGDVRLFFRHKFSQLKNHRSGLDDWPTKEQLDLLCERTGGLFVHAVATVRFFDQGSANPKRQLDLLLGLPDTRLEGKTKIGVNITLDSLYMAILCEAFCGDDPENDPRVRSVLGAVILAASPLSPTAIATLLGLDTEDVFSLLSSLHSVLFLQEGVDFPVRPFHKSFSDFILDPARCISSRFFVDPTYQHAKLLVGCLETMNRRLERNMCELPDGVTNSEVDYLPERIERYIDRALQYACRSWHKHLIHVGPAHLAPDILLLLYQFLEEKFLFWLEVLSVLGTAREAVDALKEAEKRLVVRCISLLLFSKSHLSRTQQSLALTPSPIKDYTQFVITFLEVIAASAPHIYHTALPLSPRTSTIRKLYKQYAHPLVRVAHGLSSSWGPIIATFPYQKSDIVAAWSPCNRFIAIAALGSTKIDIVDAVTFERLITFKSPQGHECKWLSFSPDSHLLTQFSDGKLVSWDFQTGGPVSGAVSTVNQPVHWGFSCTYSMDGKMVAVPCTDLDGATAIIATHDLLYSIHVYSHTVPKGYLIRPIWTHDEVIRIATVELGIIRIWEVGFCSVNKLTEVESWPIPDEIYSSRDLLFLPALSQLAFILPKRVSIWDVQDSTPLLDLTGKDDFGRMSFSSDGHFFACTTNRELRVWKASHAGYTLHQNVVFGATGEPTSLHFSPDGESIIVAHDSSFSIWPTADPIPTYYIPDQSADRNNFLPAFSPDGTLAAVPRPEENKVTILDFESGSPRLVIDAEMKISCVRVAGSKVVVAGCDKVVVWDVPARNSALNAGANVDGSVHVTTFDDSARSSGPLGPFSLTYTSISPDLNYVATRTNTGEDTAEAMHVDPQLKVYNTWTGRQLASTTTNTKMSAPYFTPDGREVWCGEASGFGMEGWVITEESESRLTKLEPLEPSMGPREAFAWKSSCGYEVTDDGWVLSPTKRRLLWLPRHWRSHEKRRIWQGRFLGFLHGEPPEVVVLELPAE